MSKKGKAHKVWAQKRMNRPSKIEAMQRGYVKLDRFFEKLGGIKA